MVRTFYGKKSDHNMYISYISDHNMYACICFENIYIGFKCMYIYSFFGRPNIGRVATRTRNGRGRKALHGSQVIWTQSARAPSRGEWSGFVPPLLFRAISIIRVDSLSCF